MVKFVILFHKPDDLEAFENGYNDFLASIEQMPLIKRRQVNTVLDGPMKATHFYRVLEVYFDSYDELDQALKSSDGQTAGLELMRGFEQDSFDMYFAEVYEEAGGRTEVE
jgi:uncharacterized protein (TIGR02118 family)